MLQLRALQPVEIIEHNLVEEERESQHTRGEKMKEVKKKKKRKNGKPARGGNEHGDNGFQILREDSPRRVREAPARRGWSDWV